MALHAWLDDVRVQLRCKRMEQQASYHAGRVLYGRSMWTWKGAFQARVLQRRVWDDAKTRYQTMYVDDLYSCEY